MLRLEPFSQNDFSAIKSWITNEVDLAQWTGGRFSHPLNDGQLQEYLAASLQDNAKSMPLKIVEGEGSGFQSIGHIELDRLNKKNGTATVARVLIAPTHRGKGFAKIALEELIKLAFKELGLRRLDLHVYDFNKSAIAVYESVGFSKEGLLKESLKVGEKYWNCVVMGLLKSDWEKRNQFFVNSSHEIFYELNRPVAALEVINVFKKSGIRRPVEDINRIQMMLDKANLIVTARKGKTLIGVARALTDNSYCCYLSDLAVDRGFQGHGIGKALIQTLRGHLGEKVSLILRSAPEAMGFYPKVGFEKCEASFVIIRKS